MTMLLSELESAELEVRPLNQLPWDVHQALHTALRLFDSACDEGHQAAIRERLALVERINEAMGD